MSGTRNHLTPLRYPGGKGRLAFFFQRLFERNGLCDGVYVEPYAGGAGVALSLLLNEYASAVHINDVNFPVYCFWHAVLNDTDALCQLVRDTPLTVPQWRRQKRIHNDRASSSVTEIGFSTFYLNRTNRSGIIASGGMIGGYEQDGEWGMDARFNRTDLIRRIERIAQYRDRIHLHNDDAFNLLKVLTPTLPDRSLIYLDPPYYSNGSRLYENHYNHFDHARIAGLAGSLQRPWVVSYDFSTPIERLYRQHRRIVYNLSYSAADRYQGSEVIFLAANLEVPFDARAKLLGAA